MLSIEKYRIIAGTSIEVEGILVKSHGHEQQFELLADTVKILGSCGSEVQILLRVRC
jgi:aspartyl/asparaginyl-tRNA synthetase